MKNSFAKLSDVKKHFALLRTDMQSVTGGATQHIIKDVVNYYGVVDYYGVVSDYGIIEYYGVVSDYGIVEYYGVYHDDELKR